MVSCSSTTETQPDIDYVLVNFEPLHKQRWRSDTVRLVCAQFPPHTRCLWHQHLKYGIYVVMAPLDMVEQPYGQEPRPLVQDKGAVFCRDHTKDKLIHVGTTGELPAFLVEVELLKEKADIVPNDKFPLHAGKGVELLNNERECRVYRFTMQDDKGDDEAVSEISLELQTEAVLLVLDNCEVEVTNESREKQENTVRQLSLQVGDDVQLTAGKFSLKLVSSSEKKTQFVLAEIY
ncbi:hypothetical protein PHYSODRAFT_297579 [Phytophthora sojae]|uniref:Uncharacterized protein n=1 Tax=Phytophthora sojae (strain P6497) TaxID=1094619 RepID=G4YYV3_PHYSP|nr:hypothetical protein PHYSODRAFT_297579 [Phytophthora sojae]EGZ26245.1 hypothetical protein PHYSODRAFT_297579 [Phytophthora sojae]|eukprot:XP_009521533.1 hypothetical protein PHYSODRAFT_297579 [Phytophthora sojae]